MRAGLEQPVVFRMCAVVIQRNELLLLQLEPDGGGGRGICMILFIVENTAR